MVYQSVVLPANILILYWYLLGRMLRQSLSFKPSFKIRGNPIVSLRGSFWASWYAETRFIFKPSLK